MADNEPVILDIDTPGVQKDGTDVDFDGRIEEKKGFEVEIESTNLSKFGTDIAVNNAENPKTV